MTRKPILSEVMRELVKNVETDILVQLQAATPSIVGINYIAGSLFEIIETLRDMENSDMAPKKYPVVMLVMDPTEKGGEGPHGTVTPRIIIATSTQKDFRYDKRIEVNYKPILYPIFEALLEEIAYSRYFMIDDIDNISYTKKDREYFGAESKAGNTAMTMPDVLDAIEFNPRIPLDLNQCYFPINPS